MSYPIWLLDFIALKVLKTQRVGLEQSGPHHHLIDNQLVLAMI
jgi:hypothetical protein